MAKLYLVPTPVGNLADMTYRAVTVLREVDLILAEDTRTSKTLLQHYQINTPMQSNHKYNEHQKLGQIIDRLHAGENIAVITDAGTPGISDPGFLVVRECVKEGIEVETLPGATAFVPALVNSGLPCDRFVFEGFLPQKKGRQTKLNSLTDCKYTMVFYESPFRLVKTLEQLAEVLGADRRAAVCREITKLHEETQRGTLAELAQHYTEKGVKGEIVIIVAGLEE
ncbi:MAG: 16S rRNA (cytidine(1402)-2'-O)-methyltransferase [Bacteroidales bacterium]|nr:16S rRNA (cytidine(1402)-2'-O)-methyltransferase [Bacteroidales bacterium]